MQLALCFSMLMLVGQTSPLPNFKQRQAPIPFRCDRLQMDGERYRVKCRGHVVVQYDTLLLCCDAFRGQADKNWQWQNLHCSGHVRGYMDGRWLWGDEADYHVGQQLLTVEGNPLLKQGPSWFVGHKLKVKVDKKQMTLDKPTGVLVQQQPSAPPTLYKKLPRRCPLPPRTDNTGSQLPDHADGNSDGK